MTMRFVPMPLISRRMLCFWLSPRNIIVITDETPMMMPSMVSRHRILLLERARRAMCMRFAKFIVSVLCVGYSSGGMAARVSAAEAIRVLTVSSIMRPSRRVIVRDE